MKLSLLLLILFFSSLQQTPKTFLNHKVIIENISLNEEIPQPRRTDYRVSLENFKGEYNVHWFTKVDTTDPFVFIKTAQRFTYIEGDRQNLNSTYENRQLFVQFEKDTLTSEKIFICQFRLLVKSVEKNTSTLLPKIDKK